MKVGTRTSELAMRQTAMVCQAIAHIDDDVKTEIVGFLTEGDIKAGKALADFGGKGAFTRVIEEALLSGEIQMAVHSGKDVPMQLPKGLGIRAVLPREYPGDVWVSTKYPSLMQAGKVTVGTGSKRRRLQAEEINSEICTAPIRGNVPTRLEKLAGGQYDGIIIAAAGLLRLGIASIEDIQKGSFDYKGIHFYIEDLLPAMFLPAAGQGIIAVEACVQTDDTLYEGVNDIETWYAWLLERSFLDALSCGCDAAAAIHARVLAGHLVVTAKFAGDDKHMETVILRKALTDSFEANCQLAREMGAKAGMTLLGKRAAYGR